MRRPYAHSRPAGPATMRDANVEECRDLLLQRERKGMEKYGRGTDSGYSRLEMLIHAREEALDLAVYLTELICQERGH